MSALIDAIDILDRTLTNSEKISDAKPHLGTVRERAEAPEQGHAALQKAKHKSDKAAAAAVKAYDELKAEQTKVITGLKNAQSEEVAALNKKIVALKKQNAELNKERAALKAAQLEPVSEPSLGVQEKAMIRLLAINDQSATLDDVARALRVSAIKAQYLADKLKERGYVRC